MYGLTHAGIVDALLAAKNRGVDVALKLDKLESAGKTQAAMITKLQAGSVPAWLLTEANL
jgi:phosphatidylserine/phosphatidylglycerophosphate/cardiolipin synthase-like enzyme